MMVVKRFSLESFGRMLAIESNICYQERHFQISLVQSEARAWEVR
jgi:hypothetical protein